MPFALSRHIKTILMFFAAAAIFGLGQGTARADSLVLKGSIELICDGEACSSDVLTLSNNSFEVSDTSTPSNFRLATLTLKVDPSAFTHA